MSRERTRQTSVEVNMSSYFPLMTVAPFVHLYTLQRILEIVYLSLVLLMFICLFIWSHFISFVYVSLAFSQEERIFSPESSV